MKKNFVITIMILTVMSCFSCQKEQAPAPAKPAAPDPAIKPLVIDSPLSVSQEEINAAKTKLGDSFVGVIPCTLSNEYHYQAGNAAKKKLEEFGIKTQLIDSEAKSEKEISAIENFTAAGAKALVICVLDPKVLASTLKEAAGQGVIIVQFAGNESAFNGTGISIDDAELGQVAGEYASKLINRELAGKAAVAILDYPDLPNAVLRANKIEEALHKNSPEAQIVGRFLGGTQENGLKSMENALQAHPEISVVVSINDAGAYGAYQALSAAGKDPQKTIIVAIDAEKKAQELIKARGMYRATVDTAPAHTGEMAAQAAVKLLAGTKVDPQIKVPVKVVDRGNE